MFAQPIPGSLMTSNTFLLNPQHEAFLNGIERKLKDFPCSTVWVFVFMLLMFGGMGGVLMFLGVGEIVTRQQLDQQGVEITATVTDLQHTTSTDSKGRRTDHYNLTYAFYVGAGNSDYPRQYTHQQSVSSGTYHQLFDGDTISIRYLPGDPTISRYLNDTDDNGVLMAVIGLPFAATGLIILYAGIQQKRRNHRLEADGQFIAGKIVEAKGQRTKNGYSVSIRYCFRTPEGNELTRKESRIRTDLRTRALPKEGTPVAVLYVNDQLYRML